MCLPLKFRRWLSTLHWFNDFLSEKWWVPTHTHTHTHTLTHTHTHKLIDVIWGLACERRSGSRSGMTWNWKQSSYWTDQSKMTSEQMETSNLLCAHTHTHTHTHTLTDILYKQACWHLYNVRFLIVCYEDERLVKTHNQINRWWICHIKRKH